MNIDFNKGNLSENIIIVDADYADRVAFDLTVNFERMLMRRIPKADLARWIDCLALDGGVRGGNHETLVVLVHNEEKDSLQYFGPSSYDIELHDHAFKDDLGEFIFQTVEVPELTDKESLMLELLQIAVSQPEVKRIMVVPDSEGSDIYARMRKALSRAGEDKVVTLFAMQPMPGGNFRQEILGYSLMNALGIKGEELG